VPNRAISDSISTALGRAIGPSHSRDALVDTSSYPGRTKGNTVRSVRLCNPTPFGSSFRHNPEVGIPSKQVCSLLSALHRDRHYRGTNRVCPTVDLQDSEFRRSANSHLPPHLCFPSWSDLIHGPTLIFCALSYLTPNRRKTHRPLPFLAEQRCQNPGHILKREGLFQYRALLVSVTQKMRAVTGGKDERDAAGGERVSDGITTHAP
jgi:hypothetical protein